MTRGSFECLSWMIGIHLPTPSEHELLSAFDCGPDLDWSWTVTGGAFDPRRRLDVGCVTEAKSGGKTKLSLELFVT